MEIHNVPSLVSIFVISKNAGENMLAHISLFCCNFCRTDSYMKYFWFFNHVCSQGKTVMNMTNYWAESILFFIFTNKT